MAMLQAFCLTFLASASPLLPSSNPMMSKDASAWPFVMVEKTEEGSWWFVHRGERFVSIGVNHVNNGGQDDGVGGREASECKKQLNNTSPSGAALCGDTLSFGKGVNYSPYFNSTMDRYGKTSADPEHVWANVTADRLKQWNFNTIGGWSSTKAEKAGAERGLYYAHLLDLGTTWLNHGGLDHDVWSIPFAAQCELIARKEVAPRMNDEYLLGWQLDNELNWKALGLRSYLPLLTPGGQHAECFLQARYNNSIDQLNVAWNINAKSFADVKAHLQDKGLNSTSVDQDSDLFIAEVATQYFKVAVSAVKKYDPNHLILGMRGQNIGASQDMWRIVYKALIPYVDVFDFHTYSDLPDLSMLSHVHEATGKPILLGEFSFIAFDSSMPNQRGSRACKDPTQRHCKTVATTQTQRAAGFTRFVTALMQLPFAVGYHWWQWADEPMTGRWPDGENSNYGLVHVDDDVYTVLTSEMTKTNAEIAAIHRRGTQLVWI